MTLPPNPHQNDQEKLIAFVKDPENIKKAVEGSMEKRQAVFDRADQNDELRYGIDPASPDGDKTALAIVKDGTLYTFTGEEAEVIIAYGDKRELEGRKKAVEYLKNFEHTFYNPSTMKNENAVSIIVLNATLTELTNNKEG